MLGFFFNYLYISSFSLLMPVSPLIFSSYLFFFAVQQLPGKILLTILAFYSKMMNQIVLSLSSFRADFKIKLYWMTLAFSWSSVRLRCSECTLWSLIYIHWKCCLWETHFLPKGIMHEGVVTRTSSVCLCPLIKQFKHFLLKSDRNERTELYCFHSDVKLWIPSMWPWFFCLSVLALRWTGYQS